MDAETRFENSRRFDPRLHIALRQTGIFRIVAFGRAIDAEEKRVRLLRSGFSDRDLDIVRRRRHRFRDGALATQMIADPVCDFFEFARHRDHPSACNGPFLEFLPGRGPRNVVDTLGIFGGRAHRLDRRQRDHFLVAVFVRRFRGREFRNAGADGAEFERFERFRAMHDLDDFLRELVRLEECFLARHHGCRQNIEIDFDFDFHVLVPVYERMPGDGI
ncbi:MAG: hypothetical protein ING19_07620 [Azospirillum sp.]|nr:hypothetical protein [Azospirillum sp.]